MTRPTPPEAPPISWGNTLLGATALAACLPAIFGCLGTFLPELLSPGNMMEMETAGDRFMVNVYTRSIPLAIMSPPATLLGLVLGLWTMRRVGSGTVFGKVIGGVLTTTILLSVGFAVEMALMLKKAGRL